MTDRGTLDELPAIGSRWYAWGRHVEIVQHTTNNGLPAVRERDIRTGKKFLPVAARTFLRHAVPSASSSSEEDAREK